MLNPKAIRVILSLNATEQNHSLQHRRSNNMKKKLILFTGLCNQGGQLIGFDGNTEKSVPYFGA
jgi:hypothetical protein